MAKLKKSDLNYEDKQYKKYWSEQFGYDYEKNKNVQKFIHDMVKAEIEMDVEGMMGEKSLAPNPGVYRAGIEMTVTSADRDAYCARYPQVCRTGTQREEALNKLKSGTSFAPKTTQAAEPTEKKIEPQNSQPETETDTTEQERKKTPVLPKPTTNKTHYVDANGSRLALRQTPASVKVSENASKDINKKGALIRMLDSGEGFTVRDPGVGYKCEWDEVSVGSERGFVYNKFAKKLDTSSETYLEYDCSDPASGEVFTISPDWTAKEPNKPFKDTKSKKWCISYDTEHTSTGGSELESRMLEARVPAVKLLLSDLGKEDTDEYAQTVVAAEAAVRVEDYYVSLQPNETMRVLVTLPMKYIGKLKDKTPEIEDPVKSVDDLGRPEFSGSVYMEDYKIRDGTVRQIVLFLDPSKSYKDRVKRVSGHMKSYATVVDNFSGEVKNLDFRKEADRFERFIQSFDTLLSANGVATSGTHSIELGLDGDYVPIYAAENSTGHYKALTSGWSSFVDSEPADSQRSVRYLFYLYDMEDAGKQGMDWMEYVGRFTDYESVEIRPSKPGKDSPADISSMGNEDNPSSSGLTAADKLDKELNPSDSSGSSGEVCMDMSIDSIASGLKTMGNSLKGSALKLKEDLKMSGEGIRSQIREEALLTVDFVGEPILADIDGALAKVTELDDVFAVVMNKITLMDLVGAILACFNTDFKIDLDIDIPLPLELPCLSLPKVPSIDFPDELPTMDIMADLSAEIFNAIVQALTEAFVQMIKDLVESLLSLCKDEAEDNATNINDAIEDAANQTAVNQDEADKKTDADKRDILDAMGLLSGDFNEPLTEEQKRDRLADLANILQDVSMLLPPSELCRLLKGMASQRTLSIVRALIRKKYPSFAKKLNTKTKIKDFMMMVGRMVTSEFCDTLARSPRTMRSYDQSCVIVDNLDTPEAERLRAKGDDITEDQILEQLDRAKERKRKRGEALQDLMNKLADLQTGAANPFQDAMPPLFCGTDEFGNPKPGLIQLKHDSIDFMLDTVLDTVFEPIYMAFNRDASSYQSVMISSTNVKKEVNASFTTESGEYVWHPEVRRMEAQGITFDFDTGFGKAEDAGNKKIPVEVGRRQTCITTKTLLQGLEGSGAFITKMDNEGIYYELVLPPDPDTRIALEQLKEQLSGVPNLPDFDLDSLMKFMPDWKVRYKNPWQFIDKDYGQRVDDEYIIEIFPGDDPMSELGLRREVEVPVEECARDYIQGLAPGQSASVFEATGAEFGTDDAITEEGTMTTQIEVDGEIVRVYVYKSPEADCDPIESNLDQVVEFPAEQYNENISPSDAYREALLLEGDARCEYILLHMHRPDLWEVLQELWQSTGCWNYKYVNKFDVYKLPPQQAVFGLMAKRKWEYVLTEDGGSLDPAAEEYLEKLRKFYSNFVHPQVTNDIMSLIAKQISSSVLFDNEPSPMSQSNGAADVEASVPVLEKIVFSREPDKYEKVCGVDPHLLSVQEFKKAAKDAFENGGGMCSLIEKEVEEGEEQPDPLREAMIKSVVQMTIRAYVIDYFMRGIFAFAEFSVEDNLDDYVLEFMIKKMQEEMISYNDSYYDKFMEYIMTLVPQEPDTPPSPDEVEPVAPSSETDDDNEHVTDADPEEEALKILKLLFIHEFAVVAVEMRDLFQRDEALQAIQFENTLNVHDKLIKEWVPVIDVPIDDSVRFSNIRQGEIDNPVYEYIGDNPERDGAGVDNETNVATKVSRIAETKTKFENGKAFDLTNGNLFLERYYYISLKGDYSISEQFVESFGSIIEQGAGSTNTGLDAAQLKEKQLTAAKEIIEAAFETAFGQKTGDFYFSVSEMESKFADLFKEIIDNLKKRTHQKTVGLQTQEFNLFNSETVEGLYDPEDSEVFWKVENYFSMISPGLRLVWVPPVSLSDFERGKTNKSNLEDVYSSFSNSGAIDMGQYFESTEVATLESPVMLEKLASIGKKYKTYQVTEKYTFSSTTVDRGLGSEGDPANPSSTLQSEQERTLHPTPLVETNISQSFWEQTKKSNLLTIFSDEGKSWESVYESELPSLKEQMIESGEYCSLFKFSIPLDRFLGLMTVYTIMSVSAAPNVESIFTGTKDELRRAFMALLNNSYKAEGPSNSDLARILDNISDGISTPCFSFSFGGGFGFKGLGIDLILKLAIKTPLLIFKAIVEMIDPNIKISKLIIDIGKFAGICLPIPAISIGLLPPTVFGFPPLGIGIGPPLTPLGFVYLALGFEIPIGNPFKDSGDEDSPSKDEAAEVCEQRAKEKQEKIKALKEKILSSTQK